MQNKSQVKSKDRIKDHGEVFTNIREINGMLDLVEKNATGIDIKYLEPACGDGNFLVEILNRKFVGFEKFLKTNEQIFIKNAIISISTIYGVELLEDNAKKCRENLFDLIMKKSKHLSKNEKYTKVISYLLDKNIVCGNFLTMRDNGGEPIVFSEWSFINDNFIQRRDYNLHQLVEMPEESTFNLFSDIHEEVFIPKPIKEFKPRFYEEIIND